MFVFWMLSWIIPVLAGFLALLAGIGLLIPKKTRRIGLRILIAAAICLCAGILRAAYMENVVMSIAKAHSRQVQNDMTKEQVKSLLGAPASIASADSTGKLQVSWGRKDLDIVDAALAWEYRPYEGLHCYRVYFDSNGRVIGKAAD